MPDRIHRSIATALTITAAVITSSQSARPSPSGFDECASRLGAKVDEHALCVYEVARRRQGSWLEAEKRLQQLSSEYPQDPWPLLYLGHVHWFLELQDTGEVYSRSIEVSDRYGPNAAGVEARTALIRTLTDEPDEAERLLLDARRIATEAGDRQLLASVVIAEASLDENRASSLDRAFNRLKEIEGDVFPTGAVALQRAWLNTMIRLGYSLERDQEAARLLQRQIEMARATGDLPSEVTALYALGVLHVTTQPPTPNEKRKARRLFEEALAAARVAQQRVIEGLTLLELGKLSSGEEARAYLEACRELGQEQSLNGCLWALAANWVAEDPIGNAKIVEEVLEEAAESPEPSWSIYGWEARLMVQWATLPPDEATQRSLDLIESIETLRDSQTSGPGRAGLLSRWIGPYYWLSGRLLADSANSIGQRTGLELAFAFTERMRARVLLEALEATRAMSTPPSDEPLMEELQEILDRKVDIQRRWIDTRLTSDERAELRERLDAVEQEEEAARQQLALAYPMSTVSRPRDFASLNEIETNLGEDEALLSFQLGLDEDFYGRFAGGSWLLAITRGGTRSYRLQDLVYLDQRLETALGFTDPGKGINGYISLYQDLLAAAVDDLPASVDKLTIIADGRLHRLPYGLLREGKEAEPLISRFQLSTVPSAKLWLRWRKAQRLPFQAPALVFADPDLPVELESEEATKARKRDLDAGLTLGRLRYARREGRAIIRTLGGGSRLFKGPDATEDAAKSEVDLRRFGILHFAAHALIDEQNPERSAVYLARGAQEDGLLQPSEIVELDLDGHVIVLASCRTAIGEVVRGEGPMSLARAFFRAEAPVVVAGLWQLPDAGTSELIKKFYRRLARGASIADALATAQREMIRDGATEQEWAGLVVLGNGAMIPFPGGLPRPIPYRLIAAIAAVLAFAALLVRWRRRSFH